MMQPPIGLSGGTYAEGRSTTLVAVLFYLSFLLHFDIVKSRTVDQTQQPEGYISLEELNLLASDPSYRFNISRTLDQVPVTTNAEIPQCTHSNYLYDPAADACMEACTKGHCKGDGIFDWSSGGRYGACTCTYSECNLPCWAKPRILTPLNVYETHWCFQLATQGPCYWGNVIVPLDRQTVECGPDACLRGGPKNAINFSKWAQDGGDGNNDKPFLVTYKNECYMTETEAFCEAGKVARFMVPYKVPFCVPRDFDTCSLVQAASTSVKVQCGQPGFVEDPAKKLCVPQLELD